MKIELRADEVLRCLTDALGPRLADTWVIDFHTINRDGEDIRSSIFIEEIQKATIEVKPTGLDMLTAD